MRGLAVALDRFRQELQVHRLSQAQVWRAMLLVTGLSASLCARADPLSAVQTLREGGCGGTLPAARPLNHNPLLDRAAQQWAAGQSISTAADRSGYAAQAAVGLHISGPAVS